MDLFVFIRHSDPTKIRIGERDLAESEVKLMKMAEGHTMSLDPSVTATSGDSGDSINKLFDEGNDAGQEHSVKRMMMFWRRLFLRMLQKLSLTKPRRNGKGRLLVMLAVPPFLPRNGSSVPSGVTKPPTIVYVPPTPNDGSTDSVSGPNLRTCPPSLMYVVSLDDSHRSSSCSEIKSFARSPAKDAPVKTVAVTTTVTVDASIVSHPKVRVVSKNLEIVVDSAFAGGVNADAAGTSKLNKPVDSSDSFYASQDLDSDTLHHIYIPKWNVTNVSVLDDSYVYRDLTNRLAPPALFAQLRAMDYDQLYFEFNVRAARQVWLGAEVRMQAKHTLEKKGGELRDLKEKNSSLEGERDVMSEKITTLESANAAKEAELASLSFQVAKLTSDLSGFQLSCDELDSKVASLKSERDCIVTQKNSLETAFELFRERMEALQDEQAKILVDRSSEYLQALGHAIGCAINKDIQDGLKAGIDHGKASRDLTVDFSLLSELESKKDSCIIDLMDSLCLEGTLAEILGGENLHPSPKQLMLSIHRPKDNEKRLLLTDVITPLVEPLSSKSLTSEASTSTTPIFTLSTSFASFDVVLPTSVASDQFLDAKLHNEDPAAVTFEKKELGTFPE
uniref:Transposase (Putative), gypsy type n=1 Tax=Tanacetum cinerariifolium TaxID=118510 RepID=A0A6L2L285_TANCI|nr:hypothetical protein [Tanacetum cinerariifolium]